LGSLILIGDKLVLLSDNGLLTIVEATPLEYHEIAKGNLPPGMYWTPPAFCRGKLYIHNFVMNEIYCLDLR
jgi:hypothetical protein